MDMDLRQPYRRIVLFGDQLENSLPAIQELYRRAPSSIFLQHFLRVASDAARASLARLSSSGSSISSSTSGEGPDRTPFDSFLTLAEDCTQREGPGSLVQTLLLCVAQLGHLVLRLEEDPECLRGAVAVGSCTGMLAAAVAACSHSLVQVLQLAPETIDLAIRIGVEAERRAQLIEEGEGSWTIVVSGLAEEAGETIVHDFNTTHNIPPLKTAYISAVTATSCTISGPPSTLHLLRASPALLQGSDRRPYRIVPLHLASPFHAPHLPVLSTCAFLYQLDRKGRAAAVSSSSQFPVQISLLSSSTGLPLEGATFRALLPGLVADIFQNRIQETLMMQACRRSTRSSLEGQGAQKGVQLVPIVAAGLQRRFESGLQDIVVSPRPSASCLSKGPSSSPARGQTHGGDDDDDDDDDGGVAIVGMSGRFPGAESLDEFWKVLEDGMDLCREIPADRFDIHSHLHDDDNHNSNNSTSGSKQANTNTTTSSFSPYGCFLDRPGMFDARLFNMSPREAASTDPGQRLLLMATYEALEMAGYSKPTEGATTTTNNNKVGTFFGQTIDDWREYNAAENVDMYYVTGGIRAFGAGRVNYHFKWDGPSYSVDSACSSSLLAIQLACHALRARECHRAVAGGANLLTGRNMYAGLSRGSFLSPTPGACKTFDATADGYCRGEGVGVVVLKRVAEARRDRDPILAVIRAAATNHSAQAVSITHPHVATQERLFREVLGQAGVVDPAEVDYVECHGTGTQAGDGAESHSVVNVFCHKRKNNTTTMTRQRPLVIGSVKPNIGHGEAAAGVSSLIKTVLMLQRDRILPHVGVKGELNPKLPSFRDNNYEIATSSAFPRLPGRTRKVMINNFSAAGGNTSILLEDDNKPGIVGADEAAATLTTQADDPRTVHIVTVSAKSAASLRGNLERLRKYLRTSCPNTLPRLADIAYTSTARRLHHPLRQAFAVKSVAELSAALDKACASQDHNNSSTTQTAPAATSSVAFVFPGQGQGVLGVARELHETSPSFRRILGELDALCTAQHLPSIIEPLTATPSSSLSSSSSSSSATTGSPVESQLCLALLEVALAQLWKAWGVEPRLVLGHSLGEYAALYAAGVLSAADVVFLVGRRAALMRDLCTQGTHKMVSLRMSAEAVRRALVVNSDDVAATTTTTLEITCVNGPQSTVVAGCASDVEAFVAQQQQGISAVVLDVPYSFHSAQMDPILERYETDAAKVAFAPAKIPVASSLLGSVVEEELGRQGGGGGGSSSSIFNASYLARHARQPVLFSQALQASYRGNKTDENTIWVEMGPGTVCASLAKQSLGAAHASGHTTLPALDNKRGVWQSIATTLATLYARGVEVNWTEFHRDHQQALSVVDLPRYAFDLKNYWLTYTSRQDLEAAVAAAKDAAAAAASVAKEEQPPKPVFSSPCWQQVEEESFTAAEAVVKFTSDLHRPELAAMVHGHVVGGISLCPSSVYASIAFSCASYLFQRRHHPAFASVGNDDGDEVPPLALSDMEIFSPCVVAQEPATRGQRHLLCVTATQASPESPVALVFSSSQQQEDEDDTTANTTCQFREHARCMVSLPSVAEAFGDATKNLYLIEDRIAQLRRQERAGAVDKLRKRMVYKLFRAAVVDYDARYHALDDVLLHAASSDTENRTEACARLAFGNNDNDNEDDSNSTRSRSRSRSRGSSNSRAAPAEPEHYVHNPFWIDSLAQLGGFALNVSPPSGEDSDDVYISHGWQSMRLRRRLVAHERYLAYVCMQSQPPPAESGLWAGDVYVYSETERVVVAVVVGLKFKQMRRTLLYHLLGHALPSSSSLSGGGGHYSGGRSSSVSSTPSGRPSLSRASSMPLHHHHHHHSGSPVPQQQQQQQQHSRRISVDTASSRSRAASRHSSPAPVVRRARSRSSNMPAAVRRLRTSTSVSSTTSRLSDADSAIDLGGGGGGTCSSSCPSAGDAAPVVSDPYDHLLSIIAREVGVGREEIAPWTKFSDIGMDSLLTIAVLATFREESGVSLPSSFFNDHPTPKDMEATLMPPSSSSSSSSSSKGTSPSKHFSSGFPSIDELEYREEEEEEETSESAVDEDLHHLDTLLPSSSAPSVPQYESKPVLLQGTPTPPGRQALFLLPDGSGSALSYIHLPALTAPYAASSLPVYALNSPYLAAPEVFLHKGDSDRGRGSDVFAHVAAALVRAVRTLQPHGPYLLAGWSMGGILAYEAAGQLVRAGQRVELLALIDSPCPGTLPPLPAPTLQVLDQAGLFNGLDGRGVSDMTKTHFLASVRALGGYTPQPLLPSSKLGRVVAIWAKDSMLDGVTDEATRQAVLTNEEIAGEARDWLLGKRKSFGAAGWDALVGKEVLATSIAGNHFSIMSPPLINNIQSFLKEVLVELGHE